MNLENSDRYPSAQSTLPARKFCVRLSSTRRGARLARLLTVERLRSWEMPFETAALVVAELASNAALHGSAPGRDFRLTLTLATEDTLRIEVTDTRPGQVPTVRTGAPLDSEGGRGLQLVDALADRWGITSRPGAHKTVWAELGTGAGGAAVGP
ncbi:ATP-binding protein [Streptomyces sp. NPDC050804]|uniref:ATP-binding protein n=1 Tax=Streptomyces sp. NPDC050804 TaxID=3154745 RepID=UPI0034237F6E